MLLFIWFIVGYIFLFDKKGSQVILFIGIKFSADLSNGADEFYVTVVMEHDYNSLPATGSSVRNLLTGSIADGGGFGS